jgi:hypothetical protein
VSGKKLLGDLESLETRHGRVVHAWPNPKGVTPCCKQQYTALPEWHRLSLNEAEVTCGKQRATGRSG